MDIGEEQPPYHVDAPPRNDVDVVRETLERARNSENFAEIERAIFALQRLAERRRTTVTTEATDPLIRIADAVETIQFGLDGDEGGEASIADLLTRIATALEEINLTLGGPWPAALAEALAQHGVGIP